MGHINCVVYIVQLFVDLRKNIKANLHKCNFYITFAL